MVKTLPCGNFKLDLSKPVVMGILNVTPDSFSDGGQFDSLSLAEKHALEMQSQGANIIDIGGESTRPGAKAVSLQQELDRIIPVVERLKNVLDIPISIDTSKSGVMREAIIAGAGMVNDIMALRDEHAFSVISAAPDNISVCLMHMQGLPRTMQDNPVYDDVVVDIADFLRHRVSACIDAGIDKDRLAVDPGFGFGKSLDHNLTLLAELKQFAQLDLPVLVGISRKSMIGKILDEAPVEERLHGSLATAVMAYERGASIIRVHDVRPTVDALRVVQAVLESSR